MPRYSANITQLHSALVEYDAPDDLQALALANRWSDTLLSIEEHLRRIARVDGRFEPKSIAQLSFLVEGPVVDNVAEVQLGDEQGNHDRVVYSGDEPRQSETAAGMEQEARELRGFGAVGTHRAPKGKNP